MDPNLQANPLLLQNWKTAQSIENQSKVQALIKQIFWPISKFEITFLTVGTRRAQGGGQRGPQGMKERGHLDGQMLGNSVLAGRVYMAAPIHLAHDCCSLGLQGHTLELHGCSF